MVSSGHALVCWTSLGNVMLLSLEYDHNVKQTLFLRFDRSSVYICLRVTNIVCLQIAFSDDKQSGVHMVT